MICRRKRFGCAEKREGAEEVRNGLALDHHDFCHYCLHFGGDEPDFNQFARKRNAGVSFVILICIIAIGIVFDIIGVAVTAADEKPFHSMASRKVPEAGEALKLIRNAGRVSSFCNDVIGDICGVISGSASATIAVRVWSMHPGMQELAVTLSMSALAAGLTVGGKACGKSFAIGSSTTVVRTAATILHFFHTIPEKLRPKRKR